MEEFYNFWRHRFAVHAVLLAIVSCAVGLVHFATMRWQDLPCPSPRVLEECIPLEPLACAADDPCKPDTILEHRWRMAHQQGLQHALLLFGFAIGIAYFRIGRFFTWAAGWLVIIGAWATLVGATLQAATTFSHLPGWEQDLLELLKNASPTKTTPHTGWERLVQGLFMVGGPAAGIALLVVAVRSAWEGLRDGIAPKTWMNWARIVYARPRRIVEPRDLEELLRAVQNAMDDRMHVRAFGGRYSWSAIAPTDGTMIDMRRLCDVEDPVGTLVWVQAGATLRELTKKLMDHKLMLKTSTVNPRVQVGGALALGCHGTGAANQTLSDLVTQIEIVQYTGPAGGRIAALKTYQRPPAPPSAANQQAWHDWNALILNLGCLGVMYRIQFECVPLFDVHILDTRMDMLATIKDDAQLRQIVQGDYTEIFWVPYNQECWVRSWSKILIPADGFGLWFWVRQWIAASVVGPLILEPLALFPYLTRWLMRRLNQFLAEFDHRVPAPDAMQYQRHFMPVYDMGYAIPYSPVLGDPIGFDRMRKAWFAVVDRLEALHHQAEYPQNLVLHARFGAESAALLAPSTGQRFSCYIEIVTHANTARHEEYFRDVERDWLRLGGRPHWGKVTYARGRIRDAYPPASVTTFLDVRRRMDPDQVFLNDYLREVLRVEEP